MEGLENEEGGEERKIWKGIVLLLCQGMPLTEIEGYCFNVHELFWTWKPKGEGTARVMNIIASLLISYMPGEVQLSDPAFCS